MKLLGKKRSGMPWLLFALFLAGCALEDGSSNSSNDESKPENSTSLGPIGSDGIVEVTVNSQVREYRLYLPSNSGSEPMPLLMAFHGGDGRNYPFPQQTYFSRLADEEGFVIAYPLAVLKPGNEGEWQLNTTEQSRHDIEFVEAVINDVALRESIDLKRVYATGYSLGSMFVYELVCQLSERFAAVASFAGTMPVAPASCSPQENMGIMHLHGVNDYIISYLDTWDWKEWDSVGTMWDIPGLVDFWKSRYNCQNETSSQSSSAVHFVHDNCDQNARVEHYRLNNIGHEWPEKVNSISTHQLLWNFLSEFSKSP